MSDVLRTEEVANRYGVSERTLRRWVAVGDFPAPDITHSRPLKWWRSTIDRWERRQGRSGTTAEAN